MVLKQNILREGKYTNQEQVRQAYANLRQERKNLEEDLDIIKLKIKHLQNKCVHPNKRKYSAMGEVGHICEDCGWQT